MHKYDEVIKQTFIHLSVTISHHIECTIQKPCLVNNVQLAIIIESTILCTKNQIVCCVMSIIYPYNPLLSDFAAVQSGEVYCTRENFYQASMELGDLAGDLHSVLTENTDDLTYLTHLE